MRLSIVLPVYNEEAIIRRNALVVYDFVTRHFSNFDWRIIIADNNSNDRTHKIASRLAKDHDRLDYLFLKQQGKGNAIRTAWNANDAEVFVFMDADLATDLSALPKLVRAISHERYDIACGSRFLKGSSVKRGMARKFVSVGYRGLVKAFFHVKTKDLPCGFKAINQKARRELLPKIQDGGWFFDSELIILGERMHYAIKEIPVVWNDFRESERKSKVKIFRLSVEYLRKLILLRKRLHG